MRRAAEEISDAGAPEEEHFLHRRSRRRRGRTGRSGRRKSAGQQPKTSPTWGRAGAAGALRRRHWSQQPAAPADAHIGGTVDGRVLSSRGRGRRRHPPPDSWISAPKATSGPATTTTPQHSSRQIQRGYPLTPITAPRSADAERRFLHQVRFPRFGPVLGAGECQYARCHSGCRSVLDDVRLALYFQEAAVRSDGCQFLAPGPGRHRIA
jgi:hypothetical protein